MFYTCRREISSLSVTVLGLTNDFSLSQLVSGLAAASQNILGLPISEAIEGSQMVLKISL